MQLKLASEKSLLDSSIIRLFEKLYIKLDYILPNENPSLIHGDLWGGNYLSSPDGAVLVDPAVYYGHREVDIAMSKLFGGFDNEFYEAYNQVYPLEVHLNIFGGSYLAQIKRILKNFT